jgi:Holliday junction DNA helicase RuvA
MEKIFGKNWLADTGVEILGSVLTGIALYNFAVPAGFPMTGFSGLALILYRLFHLPIGAMTIVLNVPVAILCYRLLGRQFFFRSVRCMILSSLFVDYVAPLLPLYTGNRLMAAICTGVLGGVGYALSVTANTLSGLRLGQRAKLYVSESIGENNFDLFGFLDKNERRCFEMLTSVSGIGPKAAMSILSHNTPEGLAFAVMSNDEKALTVAPGIGKKIAQRVILELKDKVSKELSSPDYSLPAAPVQTAGASSAVNDAVMGLSVLGYSSAEIGPALKKLDTAGMSAEQIIRAVLKQMVK